MIRERQGGGLQVVVYAGRDRATGRERYVRRTVKAAATPARTRKAAEALERRLKLEVGDGDHQATGASLKTALDGWLELAAADLAPYTLAGYRRNIRAHIEPALGDVALSKLTTIRLDRFYAELTAKGLAPATVRQNHAIIRRALGQAVRWGWLRVNPAVEASPPRIPKRHQTPPNPEDARALIAAALERDPDFGTLIILAAITGARRGELCGLHWSVLDVEQRTLSILGELVELDRKVTWKGTKTDETRRIALDDATLDYLRAHRQRARERALAAGVALAAEAYICSTSVDGATPFRPETVTQRFMRLTKRLGLTCRLHDLRHFNASQLLDAGVQLATVSERLGHRDQSTTTNIYSHPVAESDRHAADVIGSLIHRTG